MPLRQPIAFLSYVRSDDEHDGGRITAFRERLEGEVRMQTGKPFAIFQDRNDILWGQNWEERINKSLYDVTFLIPILTPSFFQSPACRWEFQAFLLKENTLGVNRLILPLYYVTCDELGESYIAGVDEIADNLKARNWTDWRPLRFKSQSDEAVAAVLATMAGTIKASMNELAAIGVAAASVNPDKEISSKLMVSSILAEEKAPGISELERVEVPIEYEVEQVRSTDKFDGNILKVVSRQPYYVYIKKFDEVVDAGELADRAELMQLHKYLSNFVSDIKKRFDAQLARMLLPFHLKDKRRLAVTILVDNSGSMRGRPITTTAAWSLLIGEWLERLGATTEFLGFTTRAWKGGQSREVWLADGKPANPGRLNDLRHLIYKPFGADLRTSAPNFSVMMREGLLKENIDGEAVLWAAGRLQSTPADKRVLVVFSDGAPVDDSTLSVNPGNFLEKHLRDVVSTISSHLTLYAIGIHQDVSRYYPRAVKADEDNFGFKFFETLINDPAFLECYDDVSQD
jgi:cobaltochelatase CobT